MNKTIVYLVLFIAIIFGIKFCKTDKSPISDDAQRYMPEIEQGVNTVLGGPMCILAGPFPIAITPQTNSVPGCLNCSRLFDAGMIEKSYPKNSKDPNDYIIQLTPLGLDYYTEQMSESSSGYADSGFCFGNAKLNKVVAALPIQQFMNQSAISIKYTMRVDNPADFLFTPQSRALGYPYLPLQPDGTSDKQLLTTIMLHKGKFSEINDSLRYGDWINQ